MSEKNMNCASRPHERYAEPAGSEQSWTPGPWVYRPYPHDDWGVVRGGTDRLDDEGYADVLPVVAHVRDGTFRSDSDRNIFRINRTDPYEANARLIAAAPDLFAALDRMVTDFGDSAGDDAESRDVIERARAALAKARGDDARSIERGEAPPNSSPPLSTHKDEGERE